MPEGSVEAERKVSATRKATPSAAIYPHSAGSLHSSRPGSGITVGSRAASASSRRTLRRSGSSRRERYRKDGSRSTGAEESGSVARDDVGGITRKVMDRLDSDAVDIYNDYGWDTDLEAETSHAEDELDVFDGRDSSNGGPTLQIYLEACKKDGITPASYFLRHVTDEHLSMKHHCLGHVRIKPICTALASSATVLSLDLEDNWLEEEGGVALCRMLKENCYISELDLSMNRLGATFAKYFADVVLSNSTLTSVTLAGNLLDDAAAIHLAEVISGSGALEYLDLSRNKLGEAAGVLLGPAIADNGSLKYLNLSFNSLRRKGATAVAKGIKNNAQLKTIDLSWNGLALEGAKALGDALKVNTTLEELNIINNRLNADAAAFISKGLIVNEGLKTLKMGKNPMQSAGCQVICAALLKNPNPSIHRLDFTDISVNEECKKLIAELRKLLPDLTVTTNVDPRAIDFAGRSQQDGGRRGPAGQPLARLRAYLQKAGLDSVSLFTGGQKEGRTVTPPRTVIDKEHFCEIIKSLEDLALTENDLEELVESLTVRGRDLIDYSELICSERPLSYYPSTPAASAAAEPERVMSSTSSRQTISPDHPGQRSDFMSRESTSREIGSLDAKTRESRSIEMGSRSEFRESVSREMRSGEGSSPDDAPRETEPYGEGQTRSGSGKSYLSSNLDRKTPGSRDARSKSSMSRYTASSKYDDNDNDVDDDDDVTFNHLNEINDEQKKGDDEADN